jgi:uncharacterized repeat protein (TIGR01451 family)
MKIKSSQLSKQNNQKVRYCRSTRNFLTTVLLTLIFTITSSGMIPWLFSQKADAHSVGQIQTTKFLAPETVELLKTRAADGNPGLQVGDTLNYIIQFSPIANGASIGAGGYVTDYIPAGTQVVDAALVQPDGAGNYIPVAPDLPGPISDGWAPRGQRTYTTWTTTDATTLSKCSSFGFTLSKCNGSVAEVYADTGIFYSTDPRTAMFVAPDTDGRVRQGTNGYNINPTAEGQLNPFLGQAQATTHNLWDADQTNAFGSTTIPASPSSTVAPAGNAGQGAAPFNAGSAVAGPDSGYQLDNTGKVGPWQRIAYVGSRVGSNAIGPATSLAGSGGAIVTVATPSVVGTYTSAGWNLSSSNPLPANTNAVRWAIGRLVVGNMTYGKISLRLTTPPPSGGLINNSEVFGGDSAQAAGKAGNDNPWRYHVPSTATLNSNLYILKEVVKVNGQPSDGAVIPANAKIRYRITYLNTGASTQTNVILSDTLPSQTGAGSVSNLTVVSGANILPIAPLSPVAGGTFSFKTIPLLNPGDGGNVEFDVQTTAAAGSIVSNKAKLISNELPTGVTSNAISSAISAANLQISKSVTPTSVSPGGIVTYTITVVNIGTVPASGISVYDFLPTSGGALNANTRFNFVTGSSTVTGFIGVTPTVVAPPTLVPYTNDNRQQVTWNFGTQTLAAGATSTITFQGQVGSAVPSSAFPYTNDGRVVYNNSSAVTEAGIISSAGVTVAGAGVINLSGTLYRDSNGNNTNDSEPGLGANVAVTLYNDANNNNTIDSSEQVGTPVNTDANGKYSFTNVQAGTYKIKVNTADTDIPAGYTLVTANDIIATVTNASLNNKDFGFRTVAIAANPNVLLVKRITVINNSNNTKNGDNLAGYIDETTNPYDDNILDNPAPVGQPDTDKWVDADNDGKPDLIGGINGGNVQPGDEIEYTIYYLSTGDTTANNVLICDRVPENVTFMPTAFNNFPTKNSSGLPGSDRGIVWQYNDVKESLTNTSDGDTAEYLSPGIDPVTKYPGIKCDGSNTNGVVVVNLGNLPNATGQGTPINSYGFIRFQGRVK